MNSAYNSARGKHFDFPNKWPIKHFSALDITSSSLEAMAHQPLFMDLLLALLSSDSWYSKTVALQTYDPTNSMPMAFQASVALGKRILDFVYTIYTDVHVEPVLFQGFPTDLWTILTQLCQHLYSYSTCDCVRCKHTLRLIPYQSPNQKLPQYRVANGFQGVRTLEPEFVASLEYKTDYFCYLLRSLLCISVSIQAFHVEFLLQSKFFLKSKDYCATRHEHPTTQLQQYQNYFFDIGILWITVKQFYKSTIQCNCNDFIHTSHKTKQWCLSGGLFKSAKAIMRHETGKHGSAKALQSLHNVYSLASMLQCLYIDLANQSFALLSSKLCRSKLERQATLCQIARNVFCTSSNNPVCIDLPQVGTATVEHGTNSFVTTLDPSELTFAQCSTPSYSTPLRSTMPGAHSRPLATAQSGPGTVLFLNHIRSSNLCIFASFLAEMITQSIQHFWISISNSAVWTSSDNLSQGFPDFCEMQQQLLMPRFHSLGPTQLQLLLQANKEQIQAQESKRIDDILMHL